jgi:hypothetical protein
MQEDLSFRLWLSLVIMITVLPVSAATLHVWQNSPNPSPPYTNWLMAAHSIQEAINTAVAGDTVLVTNGVYATGGRAVSGSLTNRVAIDKAITVQSVAGPAVTVIVGAAAPGGGNGDGAVRCAYVGTNAVLSGFTLTNGHTRASGDLTTERNGGGIWCADSGVVTNCVLTSNSASAYGGGAKGGTLYQCTLGGNSALGGGGAYSNILHYCTLIGNLTTDSNGGGASESALYHCTLSGNVSDDYGGGAYRCTLYQCTILGNSARSWGGGAAAGLLYNCLVEGNSAETGGGAFASALYQCTVVGNSAMDSGGGIIGSTLYNCIVLDNNMLMGIGGANYTGGEFIYHSCTTPLPTNGTGNITNEPAFVNAQTGDYRLRYGSPCIDAGTNLSALITNDLAGNPRPLDGDADGVAGFDMGAYEYNPQTADSNGDGIPDGWCLRYGLSPTADNVATNNPDGDSFNTFEEWVADTDPTNALSCFRIESVVFGPPVVVHFLSSSNRSYSLLASSSVNGGLWTNVPGQAEVRGSGGMVALRDTNALPRRFYRLEVRTP